MRRLILPWSLFRALVGDNLRSDQRTLGFSIQTALIGFGAVIGSWLPYVLTNWFGVSNSAEDGKIPHHIVLSFIIGAAILVGSILVTLFSTKEYSPKT
jgi:maltose/moltooligosaccharide transporter